MKTGLNLLILLIGLLFFIISLSFAQDYGVTIPSDELCGFTQCNGGTEIRHCESPHELCADHNQDGCVSATDALMVLNEAVGLCEVPCSN